MAVPMNIDIDINGTATYALPIGEIIYRTTLAANTSQSVTIPLNCTRAVFSFSNGSDVWVEYFNASATNPTGAFQPATSELNPVARYGLIPGNTIAFICPTTAYVCVTFFP